MILVVTTLTQMGVIVMTVNSALEMPTHILIERGMLPFRVVVACNESFRRRHAYFVRLLPATATIVRAV